MHQCGVTWAIRDPLLRQFFLTMSKVESDECQVNMVTMHTTCQEAGLPLEPSKTQGLCPILTFLGIELDTISMEMRLSQDIFSKTLDSLIQWWGQRRAGYWIFYHSLEIWLMLAKSCNTVGCSFNVLLIYRLLLDVICHLLKQNQTSNGVTSSYKTVERHHHTSVPISHSKQTSN